ncbi:hypothetical protein [Lederbergia citri]|uniref:Uncharacterized protein n=1 Tax=Lederbergia citri TaxID=2833580 RepID=A0A942YFC6_9BACI|nr:hypothetical protein [Lederbergia citri]MBS4193489.1 hypothetical protein [Lederbergia citri]
MYCVYAEKAIFLHSESHVRQFKEDRDGSQSPMFRDNRAIVEIDDTERYKVRTIADEVVFIGQGYDDAIKRIKYAEPTASIEILKDGTRYTSAQFKQKTAPTVFLVAYSINTSNGVLSVGMDGKKGRLHLGSWQFIGHESEVAREIREVVEEMGEPGNTAIRYAWRDIKELDDLKGGNIDAGQLDFTAVRSRASSLKRRVLYETDTNETEAKEQAQAK